METFLLRNVSFTYPGQERPALDGVSLAVRQGEFLALCGPSGCGKTTLLRQLKTALTPKGARRGDVLFQGRSLETVSRREQAEQIGFVLQDPENQVVTDKVWHELAFGLESLGLDTPAIRRRVAEMALFFGIQDWFYKDVADLSGGQKQLLNLASALVMGPGALILDEPTSQLDPIAASDFLAAVARVNRELGVTVILTEHRLEEVFPLADRVAVLEGGKLLALDAPRAVCLALRAERHAMFRAMPTPARVWAAVEDGGDACPITVREGREWLSRRAAQPGLGAVPPEVAHRYSGAPVLEAEALWFRYEKNGPDVVKGLSLQLRPGELLALLGGNGAGKTTALKLLSGLEKPYRGQVHRAGPVALLPQEPQALFVKKTVGEDLAEMLPDRGLSAEDRQARLTRAVGLCRLEGLLERHPYDLSGGERQRAALAKLLLAEPRVLFLDEPTKGMDAAFKLAFAQILEALLAQGVSVLLVSHDVEFCARYAHRCALFFDGTIVNAAPPRAFFSGNSFYTTAANRVARGLLPQAVTAEDLIAACGGAEPTPPEPPEPPEPSPEPPAPAPPARRAEPTAPVPPPPPRREKGRPGSRAWTAGLTLALAALTLWVGEFCLDSRKYYFISLLLLLECMLPFFLSFEGRRPQAREIVTVAALCAMGVAGRLVFFMLPECKPVIAIVTVSGAALGGETGFLVGALTMLVSNMMYQGPWTPWQMFAMGLIGLLAGAIFHRRPPRRARGPLSLFGALAAILIYGGIMNFQSALTWSHALNGGVLLSYYAAGFPMDCVQAAATWAFLWFGAEPLLEKLERVKVKYGLTG